MKKIIITILLTVAISCDVEGQTNRSKRNRSRTVTVEVDSWAPEKGSLFRKLTRELPAVSKVQVSQIQSALSLGPQSADVVVFQGKEPIRIMSTKILVGQDAKRFAKIWRQMNRGGSNACFAPAYLMRFYAGDEQLFETIVCFHCRNLMLTDGEYWGFDADGPAGVNLLKELKNLFPPIAEQALGADSP